MSHLQIAEEYSILEDTSVFLKLLSEPLRLKILFILREQECCVKDLVELTGAGQANISKHLSLLSMKGIVSRRKAGLYSFYFVNDSSVYTILDCAVSMIKK